MQVKSIAEHSAILSTFIKLPLVFKIFVLSIFEGPLKTGIIIKSNRIQNRDLCLKSNQGFSTRAAKNRSSCESYQIVLRFKLNSTEHGISTAHKIISWKV